MARRVSIYMITSGEVKFIQDLLEELLTLADASEYYEKEVNDAVDLLDKLKEYDTAKVLEYFKTIDDKGNQNGTDD